MHNTPLITTLVASFAWAFLAGLVAQRLKISPIVGYLFAGIMVGPFTPGIVSDLTLSNELAEIGVILLMFGVGLHFSLTDLMRVKRIAIPGALAQIILSTLIGMGLAWWWGWDMAAGLVFGLSLSVASTVVMLRSLQDHNLLHTERGRIAIAWLVMEDIAMVLVLVLLPILAELRNADASNLSIGNVAWQLAVTLGKVSLFVVLMLVVGRRVIPWLLERVEQTAARDLFTLAVLAIALGIAYGSALLFGVSLALGAFFAGVVLNESSLSHKAGADMLPFQDAFAVLFFVSVGMLFNPEIIWVEPLKVLAVVLVIVLGKSLVACAVVLFYRHSLRTALTISASLAQIGEFSFILIVLGVSENLVTTETQTLVLAGAILSIAVNPIAFRLLPALENFFTSRPQLMRWLDRSGPKLDELPLVVPNDWQGHAVLVGHGRVGSVIAMLLQHNGVKYAVIETNNKLVDELVAKGVPAVSGDAADPVVCEAVGLRRASMLLFAIPDSFQLRHALDYVRSINPQLDIVARAHSQSEIKELAEAGVGHVVMGEYELAKQMGAYAVQRLS
ncbi:MAG: YbaL family putative K(+) efflux transporter [Steroidobacteraceae bacterium]